MGFLKPPVLRSRSSLRWRDYFRISIWYLNCFRLYAQFRLTAKFRHMSYVSLRLHQKFRTQKEMGYI